MRILWRLEKAFLKDVVEGFPEPKPAYTTVSTVVRVLVKKEFIGHTTYGKVNEYYPLVSKHSYFGERIGGVITNFFDGSTKKFASFFTENQDLSIAELEQVKKIFEDKIDKLKNNDE